MPGRRVRPQRPFFAGPARNYAPPPMAFRVAGLPRFRRRWFASRTGGGSGWTLLTQAQPFDESVIPWRLTLF